MTGIHKEKTENGIREILFRGKSSTTDEWVYGAFVPDAVESAKGMDFPVGYILWYNEQTGHMQRDTVERDTVGQFTGLFDHNGIGVWEGDIINIPFSHKQGLPGWVWYDSEDACFRIQRNGYSTLSISGIDGWGEVVGNIHDNPELCQG